MNKSSENVAQNLKVGGKKRKMDSFEKEQDLNLFENPSKKPRKNLNKSNGSIIHEEKVFNCDICSKSLK